MTYWIRAGDYFIQKQHIVALEVKAITLPQLVITAAYGSAIAYLKDYIVDFKTIDDARQAMIEIRSKLN